VSSDVESVRADKICSEDKWRVLSERGFDLDRRVVGLEFLGCVGEDEWPFRVSEWVSGVGLIEIVNDVPGLVVFRWVGELGVVIISSVGEYVRICCELLIGVVVVVVVRWISSGGGIGRRMR
jgi:hypothetical protein